MLNRTPPNADYDYGQPEAEKRHKFIRNRDGDTRLSWMLAMFALLTLGFGAFMAIPGVRDSIDDIGDWGADDIGGWLDGRSLAEATFGAESFPIDECFSGYLDFGELHARQGMDGVDRLEITMVTLTDDGVEVDRQQRDVLVAGVNWAEGRPSGYQVTMTPQVSETDSSLVATTCTMSIDAVKP